MGFFKDMFRGVAGVVTGGASEAILGGGSSGAEETFKEAQITGEDLGQIIPAGELNDIDKIKLNQLADQKKAAEAALAAAQNDPSMTAWDRAALQYKIQQVINEQNGILQGAGQNIARKLSTPGMEASKHIDEVDAAIAPNAGDYFDSAEFGLMSGIATGQNQAFSQLAGTAALQDLSRGIAANAAASGGLRDPAVARAALMEQSLLGQRSAADIAAKVAQERADASRLILGARENAELNRFTQTLTEQELLDQLREQAIKNQRETLKTGLLPEKINANIAVGEASAEEAAKERTIGGYKTLNDIVKKGIEAAAGGMGGGGAGAAGGAGG